jgi:hypothetical protein
VSPLKYELGFYIPEDDIVHSDRREHLKSYMGVRNAATFIRFSFRLPHVCNIRSRCFFHLQDLMRAVP